MSAAVCGKRSYNFFDDYQQQHQQQLPSPSISKKLRRSSASSPFFPHTQPPSELVERAFDEEAEHNLSSSPAEEFHDLAGKLTTNEDVAASEGIWAPNNLPANGVEWVEFFVSEMMSATSVDDAKARASRVLESVEKSISMRAAGDASQNFHKENLMLKEQNDVLLRENAILKRAVAIQHERQKEFEDKYQELQHLKQLLPQYQEQIRTLEVNNYALMMHLRQAEQSNPISGRFLPDVF